MVNITEEQYDPTWDKGINQGGPILPAVDRDPSVQVHTRPFYFDNPEKVTFGQQKCGLKAGEYASVEISKHLLLHTTKLDSIKLLLAEAIDILHDFTEGKMYVVNEHDPSEYGIATMPRAEKQKQLAESAITAIGMAVELAIGAMTTKE
jgi:hypothetical protein